jgi:hypothetical protein
LVPARYVLAISASAGQRPALVGAQRLALPFRRFALGRGQPGARHRDLDRPECARQRPRAAAVAVARDAGFSFIAGHMASLVTRRFKSGGNRFSYA